MTSQRISCYANTKALLQLYVMDCPACSVAFGITTDMEERRRKDGKTLYCPNGHTMSWTPGKSDAQKLREAQARETALRDQLDAAANEAERLRGDLLKDRHRFANGVCPCCNRSFPEVQRHMATEHPEYDVDAITVRPAGFTCSCGYEAHSFRGLRIHQGKSRREGWSRPDAQSWIAHLTVV